MITTAEWLEGVRPIDTSAPDGKAELIARNAAIFASSTAASYVLGNYQIVKPKVKRERVAHSFVIHICPQLGEVVTAKALCGSERGRACKDPTTTTLTLDRYCSRCWNRWAKQATNTT